MARILIGGPNSRRVARESRPRRLAVWVVPLLATAIAGCSSTSSSPSAAESSQSARASSQTTAPATAPTTLGTDGAHIFQVKCAGCHGPSGEGNVGPALVGIADRMTAADQVSVVAKGRGTMLAFSPALTDEQIAAVVDYTRTQLP